MRKPRLGEPGFFNVRRGSGPPTVQGQRGDVFALEVWNESRSPRYEPGEVVYCVRGRWPQRGKDCVVELKSGDAFLKQYQREADGVIFTRQHNPDEEIRFKTGDILALHAVVGRG